MTVLRAALVTPISGPLAMYGTSGARALAIWVKRAAQLPPPWTGVDLDLHDAHPDPAAAMRAAVGAGPDVVFGPYGSGPAVAAMRATSMLVWNHGGATDRLSRPHFSHVINVPAPAAAYFEAVLEAIRARTVEARTVVVLHVATGFGREVARGAIETGDRLGFDVRSYEFRPGDGTAAASGLPAADALLVAGGFLDELGIARILLERRWQAAAFVGAGVEEVLAPLGVLREGLLGPCQWLAAESRPVDEGPDSDWFVREFRAETGGDPPYPAAAGFAAGVICARCLRDAGSNESQALQVAADRLDVHTLFGGFRINPDTGLQAGHRVSVVQWQQGVRRVVWPLEVAERQLLLPSR